MTLKENLKITIITEFFPPEIGAGSTRAYEHSKNWVQLGAEVTVITGFPDYPDGIIPDEYRGHRFLKEKMDGINIIRTYTVPAPNKGFSKRVISFFSFLISSIIQGTWAMGKQDLIISTSPPFFVGIAGYIISRIKRIPFIFEIRDLWPESVVQLGQLKNKIIISLLEKIELILYKKADLIITVTESFVDYIHAKGITREKIKVIKNGVNLDIYYPKIPQSELINKLGLNNKFVVAYIGTIGLSHAIDMVISTAEKLKTTKEIVFLLIGEGAEKDKLVKQAERLKLNNVIFLPKIPREDLSNYYSITDVLLVPLRNLKVFRTVIPSKIFEIMAVQKPIIISVDGEAREIINKANSGIYSEPENFNMLADKILVLKNNPELRRKLAENGRKFVEEKFNRKELANRYIQILRNLINNE